MRQLKIVYEDSGYCGEIRDTETDSIDSAVTGCATLQDFKVWCNDHDVTREEWLKASSNY